jgi:glyoxylase-like metal-dependent hydrolase (beta-lactamase superfamily II)
MTARIEKVVTSGTFSLDGQDFDVDNNVWLIGDDREVLVIDAAHDPAAILAAVGDRRLSAIVCTQ